MQFVYAIVCYIIVVFLTAISIGIGLFSSKIHNGDDTPKGGGKRYNTEHLSQHSYIYKGGSKLLTVDPNGEVMMSEAFRGYNTIQSNC